MDRLFPQLLSLVVCLFFARENVSGQHPDESVYEQFTVKLTVDQLGVYEMDAIYYNDTVYLPVIDLFNKLEIYLTHSPGLDTITGFILSNENAYSLHFNSGRIRFRDKEKLLRSDQLISNFSDVYLPGNVYQELFGMTVDFNFRELTVFLRSDIELPVIKQLRVKRLRANLLTLTGEVPADTTIARRWYWIRGAVLDWNLQSKADHSGANVQRFGSSFGMGLLGGELNWRSAVIRDSSVRFENTSIKWRYVSRKPGPVQQLEAGNIQVGLTGQTVSNFYGIRLTNTPYTFKKTFGSYLLQRRTHPGWDAELYMNGILVNFTTADMNGDFSFDVPLVFGNSVILIRYHGPWGQESTEEIAVNIPFSFTAHKQVEYQTDAGVTADSSRFFFNKTHVSYGLSRRATVRAGYEYFQGNSFTKNVFSGSVNLAPGKHLLVSYSYLHGSNHYAEFMYRTKRNFVLSGKHRQYLKNQSLVQTTNRGESELGVNLPILNRTLKIYFRSTGRFAFNASRYSFIGESAVSFFYKRLTTGLACISSRTAVLSWNTSFYLKKNWSVHHTSLYNLSYNRPVSSSIQLQKRFSKLFFAEINCHYSYASKGLQGGVSLYFNFDFMRSSVSTSVQKGDVSSTQTLAGNLQFASGPRPVFVSNSNGAGKAALDVLVFLDVNHNDKRDASEPLVEHASVAINKGRQVFTGNDSIHRFVSLEPYSPYLLTVANNGFPSISWILEKSTWSVVTDPNQVKKVYIPVKPMGEVAIRVSLSKNQRVVPASRLIVYVLDHANRRIGKGLTEQDGSFSFLGLAPGAYQIQFDEQQLKGLGLSLTYAPTSFEIEVSEQGDFVDGLAITLHD